MVIQCHFQHVNEDGLLQASKILLMYLIGGTTSCSFCELKIWSKNSKLVMYSAINSLIYGFLSNEQSKLIEALVWLSSFTFLIFFLIYIVRSGIESILSQN